MCCFVCCLQESKNPEKTIVPSEQVDEYVDIEDEMPPATYQSVEIEKVADVVSVSGGSGSGSSSTSGTVKPPVYCHELTLLHCFSSGFVYRFGVRELRRQRL